MTDPAQQEREAVVKWLRAEADKFEAFADHSVFYDGINIAKAAIYRTVANAIQSGAHRKDEA